MTPRHFDDACWFCGKAPPADMEAAADEGWFSSFYYGDNKHLHPVCGGCFGKFVRLGADGEVETTAAGTYVMLQAGGPWASRSN